MRPGDLLTGRSNCLPSSRRNLLAGAGALAGGALLGGRSMAQSTPSSSDMIFTGGPILTIDDAMPTAEAVAVRNGVIVAVGSLDAARAAVGRGARTLNLDGRTLLPGFFDPHGHVAMVGLQARYANLLPAPDGQGDDIPALQGITRAWMNAHEALVRDTQLVIGFGYDDSQLKERRHPTGQELDVISDSVPILFMHQSGHLGVANSAALKAAGVTASTPDPDGGAFRREDGSQQPDGVMEETALFAVMGALFTRLDLQANLEMIREGARFYSWTHDHRSRQAGRNQGAEHLQGRPRGLAALALVGQPPIRRQAEALQPRCLEGLGQDGRNLHQNGLGPVRRQGQQDKALGRLIAEDHLVIGLHQGRPQGETADGVADRGA